MEIELTQGLVAIIDECDADLAERNWHLSSSNHNNTYAVSHNEPGKAFVRMHQIIIERATGRKALPGEYVDHINGNSLDNRRANLRYATNAQNQRNAKRRKDNTSGFKGVYWCYKKWRAIIRVDGKRIHLGYFLTKEDAYRAYCEGAKKYHGEFARFE